MLAVPFERVATLKCRENLILKDFFTDSAQIFLLLNDVVHLLRNRSMLGSFAYNRLRPEAKMQLQRLLCVMNRHRPIRDKIEWNGLTYDSACRYCGTDIVRLEKGGWRRKLAKVQINQN
ncbi:hypothetical protein GGQ88_001387 [Novosphingobium hassiacum]|uniref:Uncharacterized protein n=1 Tax=Novosphingobium hassiacum TaxID=173676 RepID=A0A7W5ZVA1_9SPHN|nr:hypothetical protein [Novosphingobium hassiacum]MBB3860126.1 hypothetical protein [Novosphingobium hassiacum]